MEHATEESSGTGEAMSRYDAGSESIERKTRSSEGHGGRQDQVAEQSNGNVEEMKELEEKKSKEALLLVQKITF